MIIRWDPAAEDKFTGSFDQCDLEIRRIGNKWKLYLHKPWEHKPGTEKKWVRIKMVEEDTARAAFRKVEALAETVIAKRVRSQEVARGSEKEVHGVLDPATV